MGGTTTTTTKNIYNKCHAEGSESSMKQSAGCVLWGCNYKVKGSYLVPGLRKEQVLPLVQPQYGSLEAMQFLQGDRNK